MTETAAPTVAPAANSSGIDDFMGRGPVEERYRPANAAEPTQLTARFDWYRRMRASQPVALDPVTGLWGIFRYADVHRALTNVDDFRSEVGGLPEDHPLVDSMLRLDPPRHRALRGLVNQAFAGRRIAGMRTQIQILCTGLVDAALEGHGASGGEIDVARQISQVLPTLVIADLLGIDGARRTEFARWTSAFMRSLVAASDADGHAALAEMNTYFADIIAERRAVPGADLISTAVQAELDGERLSNRDLLQFCKLLLIAGSETTTHAITNAVLCVQQDPGLAERARHNPAVLPAIVEEVLRLMTPVQAAPREAARDIHLYDQVIPAGALVYPWTGSANRDPDVFPVPDHFIVDRAGGKSLAFGFGIHFCVGAALARLETEIVLSTLLRRLSTRWEVPEVVTVFPAAEMCGLTSLPMRWS